MAVFLVLLMISFVGNAQESSQLIWQKTSKEKISSEVLNRSSQPNKAEFYKLDMDALQSQLVLAPQRTGAFNSDVIINFPNAKGKLEPFAVMEASIMHPDLQAMFPNIRSYIGKSLKDPTAVMRFSVSPKGLHTMTLSSTKSTEFIDPYSTDGHYVVYSKKSLNAPDYARECGFEQTKYEELQSRHPEGGFNRNADDGQLRTYRLALGSSIQYTNFHGGSDQDALDAFNVTMTRVNGIYERELSITMQLIPLTFQLISEFSNGGNIAGATTLTNGLVGASSYDIGHHFTTGSGGVAFLGSVCGSNKAGGTTGLPVPQGDTFDVDFVAHEMGHQFGAPHTFNGTAGNCAGGNRTASAAYEPGSGTTIMAYAGICAPQNVQNNSDDYFHQKSLDDIWTFVSGGLGASCDATSPTGNNAPTADAGADFSIPISTPYKLTGSSTDADGTGSHTYTWEQYDLGPAGLPEETNTQGPLVRSFKGTASPDRFIPRFSDVVANGGVSTTWEKLPSVARDMTFRLTVRDNDAVGGQVAVDEMVVTTIASNGAFTVNTPPALAPGSMQTITWNNANSDQAPINAANVNILLSTDGGNTFPNTLASNVPNNGSAMVTIPNVPETNNARLLIEAADNIFYNISEVFALNSDPDFTISSLNNTESVCNIDSVVYNFDYTTTNGFSETVTLSFSGIPAGANPSFSQPNINSDGTFTLTLSNLNTVAANTYTITVTGSSPSITKNVEVSLTVSDGLCPSNGNTTFQTSTTGVTFNTISNLNSGKPSGYTDYRASFSTEVNRESSYDLTVNVNTDGPYTVHTLAWIDWNQNCELDASEEYDLGTAFGTNGGQTNGSPESITVPSDAALGATTMRVSTKFLTDPGSCETSFDGEVEDYEVIVLESLSTNEFSADNFKIFPNPNKGEFTLSFTPTSLEDITLNIYDISGRLVLANTFEAEASFNKTISLGEAQSGVYLMNITIGNRTLTRKLIVE